MFRQGVNPTLRKCIEKLLIFGVGTIVGTLAGWYVPVSSATSGGWSTQSVADLT